MDAPLGGHRPIFLSALEGLEQDTGGCLITHQPLFGTIKFIHPLKKKKKKKTQRSDGSFLNTSKY